MNKNRPFQEYANSNPHQPFQKLISAKHHTRQIYYVYSNCFMRYSVVQFCFWCLSGYTTAVCG